MAGLFYASCTGNTEDVANKIKDAKGNIDIFNIANCSKDDIEKYDNIIFGISTWGEGDLQDDWEGFFPQLDDIDFSSKNVAIFGLGDQESYCDYFVDAMGILYSKLIEKGAKVVGFTSTEGYDFEESKAVIDDNTFCGLVLDEDNQDELTDERIQDWIEDIKEIFE
jgi:flavodoxin I